MTLYFIGRCVFVGTPENGYTVNGLYITGQLLPHGSYVEYICDVSYTLVGSKILSCDGGSWNASLPSCKGWYYTDIIKRSYCLVLFAPMEYRACTAAFQRTRFCAFRFTWYHVILKSSCSCFIVLLIDFFGLPFLLAPWGFHSTDRWVTLVPGFLRVSLNHLHFRLNMVIPILCYLVRYYNSLLEL